MLQSTNDFKLKYNGRTLDLSKRTLLMGILNITPDSFFDGGRYKNIGKAIECAERMVRDGADIIDVGGESSRPGAAPVSVEEERKRVIPVIRKLAGRISVPISIDTYKARIAREAIDAGAGMINDISALRMDKEMVKVAAESGAPVCIMHMQGVPKNMQKRPRYRDVVEEIRKFFSQRITFCLDNGINESSIIIDPGIGFGKTVKHNLEILKNLYKFRSFGRPVLMGLSRKSFIGKVLGLEPDKRMEASVALNVWSVLSGASILRVHDVLETKRAVGMIESVMRGDKCKIP